VRAARPPYPGAEIAISAPGYGAEVTQCWNLSRRTWTERRPEQGEQPLRAEHHDIVVDGEIVESQSFEHYDLLDWDPT